jgi:hypothetical protein
MYSAPNRPLGLAAFLVFAATGGISTAAPAAAQQPQAAEESASTLPQPSAASVRSAERTELTGTEIGTMWTFENAPLDYWEETYGFRPTDEWLEKVRLSSVRYGQISSASFVSPNGLVMTNHHCARSCAEAVSTAAEDRVETGYYAPTREEELECPGLFLDQLISISDVTERIRSAAPAGASNTEIAAAQEAVREAIQEACEADSDLTCQVVSLYQGGQHQLYRYKRYAPVKLVFIPELQAGFFGGDPDNFTFPRYVLDAAFVRAYEEDGVTAASTPHYFEWDPEGAEEDELIFVTGNPGSTSRLATVSQVMYEAHYRHPFIVGMLESQREVLQLIASYGPEAERSVRDNLFSVENSLKAYSGQLEGLRDTLLLGTKIRWEDNFQSKIDADPSLQAEYGDTWSRLAEIQEEKRLVSPRLNAYNAEFMGSPHLMYAVGLVRYVSEMAKPEAERSTEFQGDAVTQLETMLRGPFQANPDIARMLLAAHLEAADRWLSADDPLRAAGLSGEDAEELAQRLISTSAIEDPSYRLEMMAGGPESVRQTTDPLLRLAAAMADGLAEFEARWEEVLAAESVQEERLAGALFAAFGTDLPPDATFTLRITDGVIKRYPYNGTYAPPMTTLYGLYERAANFGNEMPWALPATFAERRDFVDMSTPINFVSTNDITGGNSGSPMIDRDARVIGLAFDGNIEQLPNEFLFRTVAGRTIGVHSAGITEALRNVYQAHALLNELLGTP